MEVADTEAEAVLEAVNKAAYAATRVNRAVRVEISNYLPLDY
jgi:hypothetical protein